jgi:hypothetical protein
MQVKRVNSKEDVFTDNADEAIPHKERLHPSLREIASRNRVFSSGKIIEMTTALMNPEKRKKAIDVMEKAFCAESIKCMVEILDWELLDSAEAREEVAAHIIEVYVKTQEVCLPDSLQKKLSAEHGSALDDDILEIKKIIMNDLRFNKMLLSAIQ